MSQDSRKSQKLDTRKSILVQKSQDAAINNRRVSFRNLKEVQFFDRDVGNNPDLLHAASPLKEKINETLGSDGVFTPGRTTISDDASGHSSKNNTAEIFGEAAKKPLQSMPVENNAKFEIQATPPKILEIPSSNSLDISIENLLSSTMALFEESANMNMPEINESTRKNESLNDTAQIFNNSQTTEVPKQEQTVSMDITQDMFNTITEESLATKKNTSIRKDDSMNDTAQMFNSFVALSKSLDSAIIEESNPMNITEAMFIDAEITKSENTYIVPNEVADTVIEDSNTTDIPEELTVATIDMFEDNLAVLLTEKSNISTKPTSSQENIMGKTVDAMMTIVERRISSVYETNRGMNVSTNFSEMIERVENVASLEKDTARENGDLTVEESFNVDLSLNFSTRSKRASILSQTIRSRRRSSLNSTLLDHMPTSTPPNLNLSREDQLSFIMRSSIFDPYTTQVSFPEPKKDATKSIHNEAVLELQKFIATETKRSKMELEGVLLIIKEKAPEKVSAIETLNSRKLGPLDTDIMMAARNIAESEWLLKRAHIAKNSTEQYQKMDTSLKPILLEAEKDANICEELYELREDVETLKNIWKEVKDINMEAAKEAEEEQKRLKQAIRDAERDLLLKRIKKLQEEETFIKAKIEEAEKIFKVLTAAQKEKQLNQKLLAERVRNYEKKPLESEVTESIITLED